MTAFVAVPLALAVPTIEGVLALRLLEGRAPVLYRIERLCAGFLLGGAWSAYLLFLAVLAGVPLTFWGFLLVHSVLLLTLIAIFNFQFPISNTFSIFPYSLRIPPSPSIPLLSLQQLRQKFPPWVLIVMTVLLLWTVLKISAGGYDILSVPTYWDDAYANWNMRAQVFYVEHSLLLELPPDHELFFGGRVPSYPLTVYFTKVWIAMVAGHFRDGIVNSVHFLWFLALIGTVACSLLRAGGMFWAGVGVYLLVSLPLVLVQGTNPYSDILMAAHLFLALSFLHQWMAARAGEGRRSWLALLSAAAGGMLFIKNEALLLYLPPLTVLFLLTVWSRRREGSLRSIGTYATAVLSLGLPWLSFKILHGLSFGNDKDISGLTLMPQTGVLSEIVRDLFFTGSFHLFFPLLLLILSLTVRHWMPTPRSREGRWEMIQPVSALVLFLLVVLLGQFFIYYLTPIAIEAVQHTGYGRGVVQLLPSLVFGVILLLAKLFGRCPWEREKA